MGSMSDIRLLVSAWPLHCKLRVLVDIVTLCNIVTWETDNCRHELRTKVKSGEEMTAGNLFVGLEYLFSQVGNMM